MLHDLYALSSLVIWLPKKIRNGHFERIRLTCNGAPAHRGAAVTVRIKQIFQPKTIVLNQVHEWPPRLPQH